jgi:DnaJ like chaperone protein
MWKIILIILALIYTLNPYDILPDFMIGWGWLDDLAVLGLLGRYLYTLKKKQEGFQKYYQSNRNTNDYDNANSDSGKGPRTDSDYRAFSTVWDPYKILGIDRNASQESIKHAYRSLAGKYHPDKVEHLGDEFKALAEKRFKDIQKAYQELGSK